MTENSRSADHAGDSQAGSASASVPEGTNARRVFVKTYGCQMNVHDSEKVATLLEDSVSETSDGLFHLVQLDLLRVAVIVDHEKYPRRALRLGRTDMNVVRRRFVEANSDRRRHRVVQLVGADHRDATRASLQVDKQLRRPGTFVMDAFANQLGELVREVVTPGRAVEAEPPDASIICWSMSSAPDHAWCLSRGTPVRRSSRWIIWL